MFTFRIAVSLAFMKWGNIHGLVALMTEVNLFELQIIFTEIGIDKNEVTISWVMHGYFMLVSFLKRDSLLQLKMVMNSSDVFYGFLKDTWGMSKGILAA